MSIVGFTPSQTARLIATQCDDIEKLDCMIQDINNHRRNKREEIKEYDADFAYRTFLVEEVQGCEVLLRL